MTKEEFKEIFENYKSNDFKENTWEDILNNWKEYAKPDCFLNDNDGNSINSWIKGEKDSYLPYFLEWKTKFLASFTVHGMSNVKIYKSNDGKFYDYYKEKGKECCDSIEDVKEDYKDKILPILKDILNAKTIDDVTNIEKNNELYKDFPCENIFKCMFFLNSLVNKSSFEVDEKKYKNDDQVKFDLLWIYRYENIEKLCRLFDIEIKDSFYENNFNVFKIAKEWAFENKEQITKEDILKLNRLLWELSVCNGDFYNFNNLNIINHGAPGTGKTYSVTKNIEFLHTVDPTNFKDYKFIQFHPSYTYQDFIEGIKPLGMENGNLKLGVCNGCFKEFCIKVRKENEELYKNYINKGISIKESDYPHYFFVVDEINRGNLSNIFGETFTLLESSYRDRDFSSSYKSKKNLVLTPLSNLIKSAYKDNDELIYKMIDGEVYFGIPFNIHFIGIMNDVDRNIDAFDLAFRRRFKWILFECNYEVIENHLSNLEYSFDDINKYVESCKKLNEFIVGEKGLKLGKIYEIGHSFFMKINDFDYNKKKVISEEMKNKLFDSYLDGTIREYARIQVDECEVDNKIKDAKREFGITVK